MKKVNVSEIEGPGRRGKPVVRWKDRIKEYMHLWSYDIKIIISRKSVSERCGPII